MVLPASSWAEKDGTFTNAEGITQNVYKVVDPTGQSLPDWMILRNLALSMGKDLGVRNLGDITEEIKKIPIEEPPISDKRIFNPVKYKPGEEPDTEYPLSMVIRDILQHSGSMSTRSKSLDLVVSEALLEINEEDAIKHGISDNSHVKVTSKQDTVYLKARVSEEVPKGTVFVPTHFPHAKINNLIHAPLNGESPIVAVKVEKA